MTAIDEPVAPTFSEALRAATWADHQRAEQSPYVKALLGGDLSLDHYATMVDQHWHIYRVLEEAAAVMSADPVVGAFAAPELTRGPLLEADLLALRGPGWHEATQLLPATAEYCDRLREVCFTWPGGFVAHHYTRYLGDLSGGQFIGRFVQRHYGLADGEGAGFYRFDEIPDAKAFREGYRQRLDAVGWSSDEQARVIDEIGRAYTHNTAVFADLATACLTEG